MDIKQEKSIVGYKKKNKAWRVKEKEGLIILRMIIKFLALYQIFYIKQLKFLLELKYNTLNQLILFINLLDFNWTTHWLNKLDERKICVIYLPSKKE